ncbi:MAG: hypothetical protein ABOK23_07490 [Candidatus Methanoperedens sp.]|nr:hypothetical protein [Candidatus Methanoperedens sp.]MCZ7394863.1 hypothetical protein [Candidatus Methanoperedens sp.]
MLKDLYKYCASPIEDKSDLKNKTSVYEYLIKRRFELYFSNRDGCSLNLFPLIGDLTPDMELSTSLNGHGIVIAIEIKFYEGSSENKKNARRIARRRMDDYIAAYKEKFPYESIIPLFITQNQDFNNNPNKYPCVIFPLEKLDDEIEFDLHTIIREKIVEYLKNSSEIQNQIS